MCNKTIKSNKLNFELDESLVEKIDSEEIISESDFGIDYISSDDYSEEGEIVENKQENISWTVEQSEAINCRGKNLLVSASAGSGKTAVMTQRIVDLVCNEKVPISNFLIVTFTSASAQDMKLKIIKRLSQMPQDSYVLEQIESISTCDISDLHSFYSRLISTYFYEVEIDPSYHIIDEVESLYYKEKAISKLFEQCEKEDNEGYFKLFDILQQNRNNKGFKELIYKFSEFLDSNIDGEKWFNDMLALVYNEDINSNVCVKLILKYIENRALEFSKIADNFANKSLVIGCEPYYNCFSDLASRLKVFSSEKPFVVNAENALTFSFNRLPNIKKEHKILNDEAKEINSKIKSEIEEFQKYLYSSDFYELSLGIRASKENLQMLFEMVLEYNKIYLALKKDANGLDFNDLEKYALKILSNPVICDAVKSKYKYIFVDEYQDINAVQEKIISMISSENNRFMVGDLKQSIYGFRLCDPEIFLEKYKTYLKDEKISKVVKLNCNFRSDKKILSFVDKIFSNVMTESFGGINYAKESKFIAGKNNLDLPASTTLCFIDTTNDKGKTFVSGEIYSVKNHMQIEDDETKSIVAEAKYVAQKIAEISENAIKNNENIKYSDFAVLVFARNKNVMIFNETLKKLGLPISSDEKINLMEKPYIQEIMCFTKLVSNIKNDFLLFKVLKSRLFNFTDEEIAKIRKIDKKVRFYELCYLSDKIEDDNLKSKFKNFLDVVKEYKSIFNMMTIKDFVKKVVKDFKLESINLLRKEGQTYNENIFKLISALPNVRTSEFLINYKNFELEVQNQGTNDAVNILTIHKSKGLEYKYVFLINVSREVNYKSLNGKILFNKNIGVAFKNFNYDKRTEEMNIPFSAISIVEKQKIAEEQQRVLYVALTRAVKRLFVVCSGKLEKITEEFNYYPSTYLDWFKPIIFKELNGLHDESLVFENFNLSDFKDDITADEKQIIFYPEKVQTKNEFLYKHNFSANIPLKNSVSKILKSREKLVNKSQNINKDELIAKNNVVDEEDLDYLDLQEKRLSGEVVKNFADRGTAYHKVLQMIDFHNLGSIDIQLENLSKVYENEFKLVNKKDILDMFQMPFFKSLSELENFTILTEREFFAYVPASIVNEFVEKDEKIILQGVIDLCVICENEIFVLDYKTGKQTNEKLEKYKFQINTYAEIIERIYNKKVTKKLICFIDEKNMVDC